MGFGEDLEEQVAPMKYGLKTPCKSCPFSTKPEAVRYLGHDRASEIAESLMGGATFSCHATNMTDGGLRENSRSHHCYGALVVLAREGMLFEGQLTRIMARLGQFDPEVVDEDHPDVLESFEAFIQAQEY